MGQNGEREKVKRRKEIRRKMRKRKGQQQEAAKGEVIQDDVAQSGTTPDSVAISSASALPARRAESPSAGHAEEVDEEERVEIPPDHWLIKRRWKITKKRRNTATDQDKKKRGKDDQRENEKVKEDDDEEEDDVTYEYEIDQRRALMFMVTRLVAVGLLFYLLHELFFAYVLAPRSQHHLDVDQHVRQLQRQGSL